MRMDAMGVGPFNFFAAAFATAACSGLANRLRKRNVTVKIAAAYMLQGGLSGMALAMYWYLEYLDNPSALMALCIGAGFSGPYCLEWFGSLPGKIAGDKQQGKDE